VPVREDQRIIPLPDDLLLGAQSREERDAIMETLIGWLARHHRGRDHFVGCCDTAGQPASQSHVRYYDPPVNRMLAMKQLSSSDEYGMRIIIWHVAVASNKASVDITVGQSLSSARTGPHFYYSLWFEGGKWQMPEGENIFDHWVD
jgi:hypothetical protein